MLLSLALMLIAITGGTQATYLYDDESPLAARLCAGACTGLSVFGLVCFIFASLLGLGPVALTLGAAVILAPAAIMRDACRREMLRADLHETKRALRDFVSSPTRRATVYFFFYAAVAFILWLACDRVLFAHPDGMYTGVLNNYGDLPFHLSVVTGFVYGENFPPEDPTYLGARFTYPFMVDFVAAVFVRAGASLRESMLLENFVLGLAFVGLLHRWAMKLLRDRLAALLTPVLVLLSGGIGWLLLFRDARESDTGIFNVLRHPTHAYTVLPEPLAWWGAFRWGNAVTSLLLPQRSFLLGLPLAVIVFTEWWMAIQVQRRERREEKHRGETLKGKRGKRKRAKREGAGERLWEDEAFEEDAAAGNVDEVKRPFHPFTLSPLSPSARRMLAAGVVTGLLPLVHAHTFVVVMAMAGCLALLFREWRAWAIFFAAALVVAAPQLWWSTHGSSVKAASFFGWQTGWDRGDENVFWFWFKNTGLFIPLTVAAILWREKKYLVQRRLLLYFLPFTLCFIIPNLVRLAPWVWDNVKVLFYWYLASAPLIALLLAHLWRRKGTARVASALLFVSLTLAGALDVWVVLSREGEYREFDAPGIELSNVIKEQTKPHAVILHAPIHNHPVFLTGRRSVMGYPGHIWTHGLDYTERESEIKRMYAGGSDAERLMSSYGVEYVVVGPLERMAMPVNDSFFNKFPKVGEAGEYRLYKITRQ